MRTKNFPTWIEITAAFLLIMVLSTSGCSQKDDINLVEINESSNGGTVTLGGGQELVLTLGSNPSTGYSWQLGALEGRVLTQKGSVEFIGENDMPGSGGVEVFRFTAEEPGTVMLTLEYLRPWEEGIAPEAEFSVEVVVQ